MFSFWPSRRSSLSCCLLSTKSSLTFAFSVFESVSLMLRSHLVCDQVTLATLNKLKSKRSSCLARLRPRKRLRDCHGYCIYNALALCNIPANRLSQILNSRLAPLSAETFFVARSQLRFSSLALNGSRCRLF